MPRVIRRPARGWSGQEHSVGSEERSDGILGGMDPLRQAEIDRARRQPPEERLREALQVMADGFALKRASLRARHPDATHAELERLFRQWLRE